MPVYWDNFNSTTAILIYTNYRSLPISSLLSTNFINLTNQVITTIKRCFYDTEITFLSTSNLEDLDFHSIILADVFQEVFCFLFIADCSAIYFGVKNSIKTGKNTTIFIQCLENKNKLFILWLQKKRKKKFTPKNCDVTSGLKSTEFQIRKQFCTKISDFGHLRMVLDYRC